MSVGRVPAEKPHFSHRTREMGHPASLSSADGRGGRLHMSWGAAGETKVPRFARNDKRDAGLSNVMQGFSL